MNINIIIERVLGGIISFFVSLICPTFDCTAKELNDAGIIKGYVPTSGRYVRNDNGEIFDMSDA